MSIFNSTPVYEAYDSEVEYPDIEPTAEAGMRIAYEAYSEMTKLTAGLYIADALTENRIAEGDITMENATIVMEKTAKEFGKGIIEALKSLKNKILGWLKAIKTRVFVFFMDAAKFVSKYEKDIKANAYKVDFYFKGYDPASVENPYKNAEDRIAAYRDAANDALNSTDLEQLKKLRDEDKSNADIKKELHDAIFNGPEKNIRVNDINIVNKMIEFVKGYKSLTEGAEKFCKETVTAIDNTIKEVKSTKNDENKELVTIKVAIAKRSINQMQTINSFCLGIARKLMGTYGAVLKRVYNKGGGSSAAKPAAESAVETDYDDGASLLEAAMSYF